MEKIMRLQKFEIDKIFIADTPKERILVYKKNEDKYIKLSNKTIDFEQNTYSFYGKNDLRFVSDIRSAVLKNGLQVLLLDKDVNEVDKLSEQDAMMIFRIIIKKSNLSPSQMLQINRISLNATNVVCDLLGINVTCNPNSGYDFNGRVIHELIIPASKVILFKRTLLDYIKAKLIYDGNVCISNCSSGMDYQVARSLKRSKIKVSEQMKKNSFRVSINRTGNIAIDGISINNNQSGFQKIIKF